MRFAKIDIWAVKLGAEGGGVDEYRKCAERRVTDAEMDETCADVDDKDRAGRLGDGR